MGLTQLGTQNELNNHDKQPPGRKQTLQSTITISSQLINISEPEFKTFNHFCKDLIQFYKGCTLASVLNGVF